MERTRREDCDGLPVELIIQPADAKVVQTLGVGLFTRRFRLDAAQCGFRKAPIGYALRSEAGTLSGESAAQLVAPLPGGDFLRLFNLSDLGASLGFRLVLGPGLLGGTEAQPERAHRRSGKHSSHSMISSCDIGATPARSAGNAQFGRYGQQGEWQRDILFDAP